MMNEHYTQISPPEQLSLTLSCVPVAVRDHGLRAAHVWPRVGGKIEGRLWSSRAPVEFAWAYMYIELADAGAVWVALTFDCDHREAMAAGLSVLPPYNWLVRTSRGGHPTWCLKIPVAKHAAARAAPEQYLARVAEYMHHALQADPAFCGLGRNPTHPDADTIWGRAEPYSMDDLASVIPRGWWRPRISQTGIGRNRDMLISGCRGASANRDLPAIVILHSIRDEVCGQFPDADHPYTLSEMRTTAKKIEDYRDKWKRDGHEPWWIAKQTWRGRRSGEVRRGRTEDRDAAIVAARQAGQSMRSIARENELSDFAVRHILARDRDLFSGAI